ncbi:MAG: type II toxin-antitoxin system RelE/ParE family toxin [Nanoarchaeota archaeon]
MVLLKSTEQFERTLDKIDNALRLQIDKTIDKILVNPEIGKPMMYKRKGTREVYVGHFRLSYAYEKLSDTLILLDLYHKDEQ